jgi:hypothetical protein
MSRLRWLSPLPTLTVLAALSVLVTVPLPADDSVAAGTPTQVDAAHRDPAQVDPAQVDPAQVDPAQVDPSVERVLLAPPCGPGETQHQCDIQDNCTGRHFKDSVCCGAGTTGACLVAVNGLGCVESVDAVCVPDS